MTELQIPFELHSMQIPQDLTQRDQIYVQNQHPDQTILPTIVIHHVNSRQSINYDDQPQEHIGQKERQTQPSKDVQQQVQTVAQISNFQQSCNYDQFQIMVHEIQSREDIPQDADYTNNTDIQPVLSYAQKRQPTVPVSQPKLGKCQENDFFIKFLQGKWVQSKIGTPNRSKVIKETANTLQIQERSKKTGFKVKKLKDQHSSCSTPALRKLKTPKTEQGQYKTKNNQSQILKNNQSFEKYKRRIHTGIRNHSSNFELTNKSKQITSSKPKEKQLTRDVFYQIPKSRQVQKMSHILQDKYYSNSFYTSCGQDSNDQKMGWQPAHKVRRIIKRSPYGFLQIQVKDNKNSSKITNLRILKPKQMVLLKKISKYAKTNKQNHDGSNQLVKVKVSGLVFRESPLPRQSILVNQLPSIYK